MYSTIYIGTKCSKKDARDILQLKFMCEKGELHARAITSTPLCVISHGKLTLIPPQVTQGNHTTVAGHDGGEDQDL